MEKSCISSPQTRQQHSTVDESIKGIQQAFHTVGNMLAVLDTDLVMKVDLCTLTADMEDAEQGHASNLKVAIPGRVW
jgi:hypothetical protein